QGGCRAPRGSEGGTGGTGEDSGGDPAPILACHPWVRRFGINHQSQRGHQDRDVVAIRAALDT
ncbi:MAG: hypothetical protein ACR2LK_14665, partial [Solirubrobacteraceae bacterium]